MTETLHPEESVTTFLLIRHGHTLQTEQGKLYSDPSAMLTEKGRQQALLLANWLAREQPEIVLSSPSVRARATADAIAEITQLAVETAGALEPWCVGAWEGLSYLEIKKAQPEMYESWSQDPIRNQPPGGESIQHLCQRVLTASKSLRVRYQDKPVAIVTHSEVIRAIIVNALGMPIDNFWRLNIPTASVSRLDMSANFATLQYMALRPEGA